MVNSGQPMTKIFSLTDLNECVGGTDCSHYCQNTYGGYECHCQYGYYLSADGSTCFGTEQISDFSQEKCGLCVFPNPKLH